MKEIGRWLALILVAIVAQHAGAEKVRISGRVSDSDGNPIDLATIRVLGTTVGTTTDLEGRYSLSVGQADTIAVRFSCLGFRTVDHKLVSPQGDIRLNVRLRPLEVELEEVQVTSYKPTKDGMQSVSAKSFRDAPELSGGSVEALITTLPGVSRANELSTRYSARGGSYDENSVYINGVEAYRPLLVGAGQQEGLSVINPNMAGDVKFSAGGFPARYGDRMSSALDITYRVPERFELAASGSLMGASLTIGSASRHLSQLHGFRYKRNTSVLSRTDTRGEYDPSFFDYQGNFTYKFTQHWSANVLAHISLDDYKFTPADRTTAFGTSGSVSKFKVYFDGREHDKFQTWSAAAQVRYQRARGTELAFGAQAFLTDELVSYDISGEYWLDRTSDSDEGMSTGIGKYAEHARNRLRAYVWKGFAAGRLAIGRHSLRAGISAQYEHFRDCTREWEWRDSAGYSVPIRPDAPSMLWTLTSRQEMGSVRGELYAEDAMNFDTPAAFWTLNVGARGSYWSFNKEWLISPRINVSVVPRAMRHWTFRAAAGIYYQTAFYKEFRRQVTDDMGQIDVVLNRDIKAPRSIQALLGADFEFAAFGRLFRLTMEGYYKNLARLISYENDNLKVVYSGENDASGHAAGLDFRLFGQFVPGADSWLSFSLMSTRQNLNGVSVPLPNDQRYSVSLFFTDYFPKVPKLKFNILATVSDGRTHVAPGTDRSVAWFRAPAYKRLDAGLSYEIIGGRQREGVVRRNVLSRIQRLAVGFDVFNLLDIANVGNYFWVTDAAGAKFAVPNYLTRRQFNISLSIEI